MLSLNTAKKVIVIAGCFAMAYTQLTLSPAMIEFARHLGASGLQFGILGALPTGMLFMQFAAAIAVNHLRYRKGAWLVTSLFQRLICVPAALGPWLLPEVPDWIWVWVLLALVATTYGLLHFTTPLWLSWMGDYLPHHGLNHFWGIRQLWMQWAAAVSLLASALLLFQAGLEIRTAFLILLAAGAVLGVTDLMLFLRIEEPPVAKVQDPRIGAVLRAPFRHRGFRSFILFSCFWNFAAMTGAPFISLFLLSHVGMDLYHVLLLWTFSWTGGAILSSRLGALTERHGQRPVLILCTALKSSNMIALLLVPPNPTLAFWLLVPVFMIDAALNAGIAIANNGFLLKNSPTENRTMFIAAGMALAGMVGGATSIFSGLALDLLEGEPARWFAGAWTNFHTLFAVSLGLRLVAAVLALRVEEETSHGTRYVLMQLVGATPLRYLRYPLGLYRSWNPLEEARQEDGRLPAVSRQHVSVGGER